MWRSGVGRLSPEGGRWSSVTLLPGCDVVSISCGATGLVWVIMLSGKALVRGGITGVTPTGTCLVNFTHVTYTHIFHSFLLSLDLLCTESSSPCSQLLLSIHHSDPLFHLSIHYFHSPNSSIRGSTPGWFRLFSYGTYLANYT